ncbi:hypothetical protein P171DRAFT_64457 [Karstenula rhodostoma CBS 690.94]|uniref:Uncharacterized protein n=1 Tax=Karstenula rhodostoma CBS 690.94 TaxID=1392251 RepID=A0A9P4PC29_9PLEO|nr:hypothetical protein P171DRAFT_64457 [Karstenula rhodostoma CBS 690.94]
MVYRHAVHNASTPIVLGFVSSRPSFLRGTQRRRCRLLHCYRVWSQLVCPLCKTTSTASSTQLRPLGAMIGGQPGRFALSRIAPAPSLSSRAQIPVAPSTIHQTHKSYRTTQCLRGNFVRPLCEVLKASRWKGLPSVPLPPPSVPCATTAASEAVGYPTVLRKLRHRLCLSSCPGGFIANLARHAIPPSYQPVQSRESQS